MKTRLSTRFWVLLAVTAASAGASAWMLLPLRHIPLSLLSAPQANRVAWGWAIAAIALGLACLLVVALVHAFTARFRDPA